MNDVMRIVKSADVEVLGQTFDNSCSMTLSMRADIFPEISGRILAIDGVTPRE